VSQSSEQPGPDSLFSPLLEAAVRLAAQGHYHQFRKGGCDDVGPPDAPNLLPPDCVPYITHPIGSMCILARLGAGDEVLAAALLHDYLEDVPDPLGAETIRQTVGGRVLDLVLALTENKRPELADSDSWEERKREQIDRISNMPGDAVLIKAADLLHNVESLLTDLASAEQQHTVWSRLNAGPEQQLWHFDSVLTAVRDRLSDHPLVNELESAISRLRAAMDDVADIRAPEEK
jgi:(p)ppGpp synthase/HD superfamily hydrolase